MSATAATVPLTLPPASPPAPARRTKALAATSDGDDDAAARAGKVRQRARSARNETARDRAGQQLEHAREVQQVRPAP